MNWYVHSKSWSFILRTYLPRLALCSLAWEIVQLPLYTLWSEPNLGRIAYAVAHCTVGDALIGTAALVIALILSRANEPANWPKTKVVISMVFLAVAFTVLSERSMLLKYGLQQFNPQDRQHIFHAWHELPAWPDFPAALARIRQKLPAISFTMLPLSLVLDVSRKNDLAWDAVISCEMIGVYKPHPEAYLKAAQWLGLEPAEILMVACHNFDLNAARACGFKTAFVRRPAEWGPEGPPDPIPHPDSDIVVDGFEALADKLGL